MMGCTSDNLKSLKGNAAESLSSKEDIKLVSSSELTCKEKENRTNELVGGVNEKV